MVRVLNEIRMCADYENEYFEEASVRLTEQELKFPRRSASQAELFNQHWRLAVGLLRLGRVEEAIEHFLAAESLSEHVRDALTSEQRHLLLRDIAVAYLRLGETQNCIHCRTGESCILPIRGGGIHQHTAGSEKAIERFEILLREFPDDLSSRWLLNIAYMTLGEYPHDVPDAYLIPEDSFRSDEPFPAFIDVAEPLGLNTFDSSGGVVVDDFDNDNELDIITSSWAPDGALHYFRNNGDGTFTERSKDAGFDGLYGGLNMVQADYDNDGDADLLILRGAWLDPTVGQHPNSLLRNDGHGCFVDVTFAAGLGDQHFPTHSAAWADFDNDGDLDLFVANERTPSQLFENRGDGTFRDIAESAGVTNENRFAKGVGWGDHDNDRWPDLFVSNLQSDNRLYRNNADGTFTDVAASVGVTKPRLSFPVWFWDYNNDGALDIYAPSYDVGVQHVAADYLGLPRNDERDCLYQGDGKGGFRQVAEQVGLTRTTQPMGCNFGDLDNDGYLDFYLGTGYVDYTGLMPNLMFRNDHGKRFVDITMPGRFGHLQKGHGTAFADLDHDGDQDVFIQMGGANPGDAFGNVLFENPGFDNHWIVIRLVGESSNRSAIGARIRVDVDTDGRTRSIYRWVNSGGSFGANPLRQHIGLGNANGIRRLEVYWPTSDITQHFENVEVDQFVEIREGTTQLKRRDYRPATFAGGPPQFSQ